MQVSLEDAYREATTALGEALVRERLLLRRVAELEAEHARPPDPLTPAPGINATQ